MMLTAFSIIPEPIYCQENIPNNNLITMAIIIVLAILLILVLVVALIKILSTKKNNKK